MSQSQSLGEFSFKTRQQSIDRFKKETFDLLVVGGGITGAAVARDAARRGLSVALIEQKDFAWGTSSRSSKLIHGGLRYLEKFELKLVFEALSERALLLKTVPHMVKPLPFYFPVFDGDSVKKNTLSLGLWFYDLLALFRTPGFHKKLNGKKILEEIPFLKKEGLLGGFRYFDASMWDDVLAVEVLRSASSAGAAIANYVQAVSPIWEEDKIKGFCAKNCEAFSNKELFNIHAKQVVICAGPWTDILGKKISSQWHTWLQPSKGIHLIFDLKKIPVPGAMVMNNPVDGRVSFVIPRPDMGSGVAIVGTTDGPVGQNPDKVDIESADVHYLMKLLNKYFPKLELKTSDILSAYVGVRPLMGSQASTMGSEGQPSGKSSHDLQKVSREHYIGTGPGRVVLVAGGKYTTHRTMAEEIVDLILKQVNPQLRNKRLKKANTRSPINPNATIGAIEKSRVQNSKRKLGIDDSLFDRYGAEALSLVDLNKESFDSPKGFPMLLEQLRLNMKTSMVVHLEDFFLRRTALYSSRSDYGWPWAQKLAQVWAQERGLGESDMQNEIDRLKIELDRRSAWKKKLH